MSTVQHFEALPPHVAVIPTAGMGHLVPFLRLASMLSSRNCMVTLVTAKATVSAAESNHISFFLTAHPQIRHLQFDVIPVQLSEPTNIDPFFLQYNAISCSAHLLRPLLSSSSPPLSAIFCDLLVAKRIVDIAYDLRVPFYVVISTSAKFFSFMLHLPALVSDSTISNSTDIEIPGLTPLPISSIPVAFLERRNILAATIISNLGALSKARGVLINTFDWFEAETLAALNSGRVLSDLPPVLSAGPLVPYELEKDQSLCLPWLDTQPAESVVYVSFGSRTAMSNEQIRELRDGLDKSGSRFLWIVKTSKIDKDDNEDLTHLLGDSFFERTKNKGMVLKEWVNQQEILAHPATGGFISHCGWNSVMEAAQQGIPVLAWPQHGDQKMNAEIVEKAGLGIFERTWSSESEGLVKVEEIAEKIVKLMEDGILRRTSRRVREEVRKATGLGGSSEEAIMRIIENLH